MSEQAGEPGPAPSSGASAPAASRRERRRERNRAALLAAARRCFRRQGYLATTVSDITDEADVAHGTFYSYFSDKGEIFGRIVDELLEDLLAAVHDVGSADTIRERLEAGLGALFRRCHEERGIVRALRQAGHVHAGHERAWAGFRDRLRELAARDLGWLSRNHYTKPIQVDLVATVVTRMVEGVALEIVDADAPDVDGLVVTTADLYYDAVFGPATR